MVFGSVDVFNDCDAENDIGVLFNTKSSLRLELPSSFQAITLFLLNLYK